MRVVHVITRLIVGGAQENTIDTVLGLAARSRAQVQLLSGPTSGPEGSLETRFADSPHLLEVVPELVRPIHPWKDLQALRALTRRFRRDRPEIVHTHSGKAGIVGRWAAHWARVPVIVHTIHGPSFGAFQGPLANAAFRTAERQAGCVTTHFIAVSQAMIDQYLAADIGHPGQYTRIFSGFDLEPFVAAGPSPPLRAQLGLDAEDIVVGKIARLFKLKGHDDLFAVAPRLIQACPNLKFLLVGDGLWRSRFEQLARTLGLESHFRFTGLVAPSEVPQWLGIMDMVVHLSRREGLPRALPQALAAARPLVAYDCDGAREVCRDGETGFLVPAGDLAGLADRILTLARNRGLRAELGRRGRALVLDWFPVRKMVDDIYQLYVKLLASV